MIRQSIAVRPQDAAAAEPEPHQETLDEAMVRPSARRVFTHNGCGGYVLFEIDGGHCIACGAAPVRPAEYSKPQTAA